MWPWHERHLEPIERYKIEARAKEGDRASEIFQDYVGDPLYHSEIAQIIAAHATEFSHEFVQDVLSIEMVAEVLIANPHFPDEAMDWLVEDILKAEGQNSIAAPQAAKDAFARRITAMHFRNKGRFSPRVERELVSWIESRFSKGKKDPVFNQFQLVQKSVTPTPETMRIVTGTLSVLAWFVSSPYSDLDIAERVAEVLPVGPGMVPQSLIREFKPYIEENEGVKSRFQELEKEDPYIAFFVMLHSRGEMLIGAHSALAKMLQGDFSEILALEDLPEGWPGELTEKQRTVLLKSPSEIIRRRVILSLGQKHERAAR